MTTAILVEDNTSGAILDYRGHGEARWQVWYNATTCYQFFKGPGGFNYRKSTDSGATWGSGISLVQGQGDFGIYYERWSNTSLDPVVHVVAYHDSGTRGLYYTGLTLSADTVSFAYPGTLIHGLAAIGLNGGATSVGVARNGDVHVVTRGGALASTAHPVHLKSTDGGATFVHTGDQSFSQTGGAPVYLVPDGSSGDTADMLAFNWSVSTLSVSQWDNSADVWLSPVTVSTAATVPSPPYYMNLSVAYRRSDGHVMVAVVENGETAAKDILCWDVNGTASITARTNVLDNTTYMNCVALTVTSAGDIYCFYARDNGGASIDSMEVYYKKSSDSMATWGSETAYSTAVSHEINMIEVDPSPDLNNVMAAYQFGNNSAPLSDLYVEYPAINESTIALTANITLNFALTGTLTGVVSGEPPIIIKCRPIDGPGIIRVTVDSR